MVEFPALPTWRLFFERLATEYNTEIYDASQDIRHAGYPAKGIHLTRRWKESRLFAPILSKIELDKEMWPSVLDELCGRLQIDPKDFGLVLH